MGDMSSLGSGMASVVIRQRRPSEGQANQLLLAAHNVRAEAMRLERSHTMNLAELTARMHAIRDHNDWRRYQSPKNLVMAASVEMAELVEIFQWLSEEQSRQLPPEQLAHAGQEVADVVLYLLQLCSELGLDMNQAVLDKLADNERRFLK
jgi:NTP pyrophosphatase (non-canonical NTP hydrolase)